MDYSAGDVVGHVYRNDRQYDIVRMDVGLNTPESFRLYHKHDSGATRVGFYCESTVFPDHYSVLFSLKHIPVEYNESLEWVIDWLLDQHEKWLEEQFELAFSQPT